MGAECCCDTRISFACRTVSAAADPNSWQQQVIYLIMPDRFSNGDAANDQLGIHNGTLQGAAKTVPGLSGQAFQLDGNGAYVDLGRWSPGSRWTAEAWVNPSALPSGRVLFR